jgi:hypothetical protein
MIKNLKWNLISHKKCNYNNKIKEVEKDLPLEEFLIWRARQISCIVLFVTSLPRGVSKREILGLFYDFNVDRTQNKAIVKSKYLLRFYDENCAIARTTRG